LASEDIPENDPWWCRYFLCAEVDRVDTLVDAISGKGAMRRLFRQKRDAFVAGLSIQENNIAFSVAPSMLKSLFIPGKTVAAYMAIGSEADPAALLRSAHVSGCRTALPHVTGKVMPMQFLEWKPEDPLEMGAFDLLQPQQTNARVEPDIILVPLIAFDRRLTRLGQGGGHYDRALSLLGQAITVGIAWSIQEIDFLPADPWDIPLNHILTEKEWISL
jgi:5-formyltetrahydrofolate cyclo-ligase